MGLVASSAALRWDEPPVLRPSWSNDVWLVDDPVRGACVLRIAWHGARGRLITEARVGRALPPEVGFPRVLGFGATRDDHDLVWSLTRRLRGESLASAWPGLGGTERKQAVRSVARRLRALHRWRPSATLSDRLLAWPRATSVDGIVGATLNPLPLERVRVLAERADAAPGVDAEAVRAAYVWLAGHADLAPDLDRPGLPVLHGDLHTDNVWWDGERVGGLLDLEWARLGEAHLDLARLLDPDAGDETDGGAARATLADGLRRHYPELVVPALEDRLRFFRVAYLVRQMLVWPVPTGDPVPPDHPSVAVLDLIG